MSHPVSRLNAEHYKWGEVCDGWRLIDREDLSIMEERVPPGASECRHYHKKAWQFFYMLEGKAVIELEGVEYSIAKGEGIEVQPGKRHQFLNRSSADVVFLVTSSPSTKDDRYEA